jgi:hypothetical protein
MLLASGLFFLTFSAEGNCATIAARSLSQSDVQAAINSANEGDTVTIPAGSASWSSAVSVGSKGLTILGAGIDGSVISGAGAFSINGVEGKSVRISGFTFSGSGAKIVITGTSKAFRIDHIKFNNLSSQAILVDGYTYGVVDHCQFVGTNVFVGLQVFDNSRASGVAAWKRPLTLGTGNAVYVEDCVFDFVNYAPGIVAIDSRSGGRYVFRYNRVKNINIACHDAETTNQRGTFSWEVYGNVFEYTAELWTATYMRGGTGVIFNNKFTAPRFNWGSPLRITSYRSTGAGHGTPWNVACDGTRDYMWSDVSGNCSTPGQVNSNGAVCVQMDGHLDSTGYPCIDQLGRTYDANGDGIQDVSPAYEWNNTNGTGDVRYRLIVPSEVSMHLKEGRDYFCGTPKPGYTPYTYPHPLVTGGGTVVTRPGAPANLRIQ